MKITRIPEEKYKDEILLVSELCLEAKIRGFDVFFRYSPHVSSLEVEICRDWHISPYGSCFEVWFARKKAARALKALINTLLYVIENNDIPSYTPLLAHSSVTKGLKESNNMFNEKKFIGLYLITKWHRASINKLRKRLKQEVANERYEFTKHQECTTNI